jgi:tetratricopeptide (TPR) repeat protein
VSPRRRTALAILIALFFVHVAAVGLYTAQAHQQALVVQFLEARDAWKAGHLDEAAARYREVLVTRDRIAWPFVLVAHYPNAADASYLLGRVETDRGQVDAALTAFAASLRLGGRGARETRELLLTHRRLRELKDWATSEIQRSPSAPQPYKDRAAASLELGDAPGALADYSAAIDRLPAWRRQRDPAAPMGMSAEEADLLNLTAAAWLAAGDRAAAARACQSVSARQGPRAQLDRLCKALLAQHDGRLDEARKLLGGYLPPAAEHEWLTRELITTP